MARNLDELEFDELLDEFSEQEKIYRLEGYSGVKNLAKITSAIGYDNINEFLADNPGAIEAVADWLYQQDSPDWKTSLVSQLNKEDN